MLKEYYDKAGVTAEMFLSKAEPKSTGNYSEMMRKFFFKHLGVETKVVKGE